MLLRCPGSKGLATEAVATAAAAVATAVAVAVVAAAVDWSQTFTTTTATQQQSARVGFVVKTDSSHPRTELDTITRLMHTFILSFNVANRLHPRSCWNKPKDCEVV